MLIGTIFTRGIRSNDLNEALNMNDSNVSDGFLILDGDIWSGGAMMQQISLALATFVNYTSFSLPRTISFHYQMWLIEKSSSVSFKK